MTAPKVSLKLPPPNNYHSPDDPMKMSRRFIRLARIELGQERRMQASEKAWGGRRPGRQSHRGTARLETPEPRFDV